MINFAVLLSLGLIFRLLIILYGDWHDHNLPVPFTDIDYSVFTDAARYVTLGESPYLRHTYRYPPILAWLLMPNITLHPAWGKFVFSMMDMLVTTLVRILVRLQGFDDSVALKCSLLWLFNPISIIISTRGNSDALIAAVVLMALVATFQRRPFLSGVLLGFAIHIRLYPIIFSLPIYLSLKSKNKTFGFGYFAPNKDQLKLVTACVAFLTGATYFCYYLYGNDFLNESIFYHLSRRDTRHNFSLFFYLLYLSPNQLPGLLFVPQAILLLVFSCAFHHKQNLSFCLFVQTFAIVAYNPVVTSQYWIWVLSLLAPNIPRLKVSPRQVAFLCALWLLAQLAWLVPAYLLEFRGRNTFLFIWLQGIGVFCANLAVLVRLIRSYDVFKPQIAVKID